MKIKNFIEAEQIKQVFHIIADVINIRKQELGELDAIAGDGDLGVTLSIGFTAVAQKLSACEEADVGKILLIAAQALAQAAPSTLGTLLAMGLLRAARMAIGKVKLTPLEAAELIEAARQEIEWRGKAQQGDKTLLDALIPAERAWKEAAVSGCSFSECAKASLEAARKGCEATRNMIPKVGRASWLKERSLGHLDAGAAALVTILEAITKYFECEKRAPKNGVSKKEEIKPKLPPDMLST